MGSLVAVYTRISKDDLGTQTATARQEKACRQYVQARGWQIGEVFEDADVSAFAPVYRPAFERLLEGVAEARFDFVVVWKLDRLLRRPSEFERFWAVCERTRTGLASVTEPLDSSTDLGLALVRILVSLAALESATIGARLRAKAREMAERGLPPAGARRFGYTSNWEIVPEEAAAIREAAGRILAGEARSRIIKEWNGSGRRGSLGAYWTPGTFTKVMVGPHLAAQRVYHGEVIAQGVWEPILDRVTSARLRAVMTAPTRGAQIGHVPKALLRGLLLCGVCGRKLTLVGKTGGHGAYRCMGPLGCRMIAISAEPVERLVVSGVVYRDQHRPANPELSAEEELRALEALAVHRDSLRWLTDDYYVRHTISREEFLQARAGLLADAARHTDMPSTVWALRPAEHRSAADWKSLSPAEKRSAVEATLAYAIVEPATSTRRPEERVILGWWDDPSAVEEAHLIRPLLVDGRTLEARSLPPEQRAAAAQHIRRPPPPPLPPGMLTATAAAAALHISQHSLTRLTRDYALPVHRFGTRVGIDRRELEAWAETRMVRRRKQKKGNPCIAPVPRGLLTPSSVARRLRITPGAVTKLIRESGLPAQQFGRNLGIDPHDLAAWAATRKRDSSGALCRSPLPDGWLSPGAVAQQLALSPSTVNNLIASGGLPARYFGRFLGISKQELDAWILTRQIVPRSHRGLNDLR